MNMTKTAAIAAILFAGATVFTSCNSNDEPGISAELVDLNSITDFNQAGYWSDCYNEAIGAVRAGGFAFSHQASSFTYGDQTYTTWSGFCPSKVNDNQEYPTDWVNHQWASIVPNPMGGIYLVGYSDAMVNENPVENKTCSIEMTNFGRFNPKFVYVSNSSYTYYCAKNGSPGFSDPFTATDELILNVVGVLNGTKTGHIKAPLIARGQYLTQWGALSLESLGTVDQVLFYLDSTAKDKEYGIKVPTYFCISGFGYTLPESFIGK